MEDAEALNRLESLRKKKRSKIKEGLVKAVMLQTGGFEDKIRRIEMIDLMPEEQPAPKTEKKARGALLRPPKPPPPLPAPEPPPDESLAEPKRVEQFRRRLAGFPVRAGFWAYLTREFGALIQFGARTSTLTRGFFFFTLRLSSESTVFLTKTLKEQVLPVLEQTLPLVAKKSWLHLNRFEYNLLASLRDLARTIGSVEVPAGEKNAGGPVWDVVVPGLRLFWTEPTLVDRTLQAWDLATTKLGCSDKTRQTGHDAIRTLLETRTDALSLPDVLLALLQLRARRAFDWTEGAPGPGEYFLRDSFDCSPEIQVEIEKAAAILTRQLEVLERESQEIRRIRYFLPADDLLAGFDGTDRTKPEVWCQAFLRKVEASFGPLLGGTVVFADGSRTELFRNASLDSSLARLKLLADQMAAPEAAENPELIASAARVIMNLGKTLVVMIRNRSLTADPLVRSGDPDRLTDPLPQEESVLELPGEWAGLTVINALVKAARLCLQAGRLLGDTSLETSLEKETTLAGRAADLLTRLARLVPPSRVEGLKKRWEEVAGTETGAQPG